MIKAHNSWFIFAVLAAGFPVQNPAATVYNEALSGDLSNSGLTPSVLLVSLGSNQIFGTTGGGASGTDRERVAL